MDDEVRNLLVAWNLEEYVEVFKENAITSLSMSLLGHSEIKELLPKLGPRAIFIKNLEAYRNTMHSGVPDPTNNNVFELPSELIESLSDYFTFPIDVESQSSPSTSACATNSPVPTPLTINLPGVSQINVFDLKLLLNNSLEGKGLLNLDKTKSLDNAARQRLVRIIGTSILKDSPEQIIRTSVYANWTHEIVRVFPQEKPSAYFHSKIVESTRGLVTRLAGKLPDQIHNLKRKYRETGVLHKHQRLSRSASPVSSSGSPTLRLPDDLSYEDDVIEDIEWLKNSTDHFEKCSF